MDQFPIYISGEEIVERLVSRIRLDTGAGSQIEFMRIYRHIPDLMYVDEFPWLADIGDLQWNENTGIILVDLSYTDHHFYQ